MQVVTHNGHEAKGAALVTALCNRLRVPNDCKALAQITARWHGDAHNAKNMQAPALVTLLQHLDAFRQPQRFEQFLQACAADYYGRPGYAEREFLGAARLQAAYQAAADLDTGAIAQQHQGGEAIKKAVYEARCAAVAQAL